MPVYDPLADPSAYSAVAAFCYVNVVCTSLLPLPAGWLMMIAAGVLFGEALGLVLYLLTSCLGAMITLAVVRSMPLVFESGFRSCLGKHTAAIWRRFDEALLRSTAAPAAGGPSSILWRVAPLSPRRLDEAIHREGFWVALVWRAAPLSPFVVSSTLISLTAISVRDYAWTTALGVVPSSATVVIGAALVQTYAIERQEVEMAPLAINSMSFLASMYVTARLGSLALNVMRKGMACTDVEVAAPASEDAKAPSRMEFEDKPHGEDRNACYAWCCPHGFKLEMGNVGPTTRMMV
jgi:uncharacterized membrane protein YdjX (TVP38/TMEM64 family)